MATALALTIQNPLQAPADIVQVFGAFDFVVNIGLATLLGLVLALVYRHTHKGLSYSQSFTQTILLIAVIVAIVMMTIENSLARAFALVGALSIIRFRTVVKDTRDTAFVFSALAIGMACGTAMYELAVIGTAFLCAIVFVLYATNFGALYKSEFVLRFTFEQGKDSSAYLTPIQEAARRSNLLHIEPSGDGRTLRLTYDITLNKDATAEKLAAVLGKVAGVSDVVLIVSKQDVDY